MTSVKSRLLAGFSAKTFGTICVSVVQIVSVSIFLSHWGAKLYGDWIILNAIPNYLLLSDIGFGSAAVNDMAMLVAAGDREEAISVFQSVWLLSTLLSSIVGLSLLATIWFIPLGAWLHISELSAVDTRLITVLLGISALFGMQETLFQGAFRCVGKYAFGALTKSLITSAAFCGVMVLVALGRSPSQVAIGFLFLNALGTVALWILLRRQVGWLRIGIRHAHWRTIRRLFSPGISFLSIPIGNAISLQGVLLVTGQVLGPIAVVTYNTARTLSRTAFQAMNMINESVWPEVSTAFGAGDLSLARRIHRRACQLSVLLCIGTIAGGILIGPYIWQKWTMGAIPTDHVLLDILFIQLLFASFWFTSSVVLVATNRHQGFAKVFLATTCFSLFLAWLVSGYFHMGLRGVAGAMVVGEIITSLYVLPASMKLVDDNLVEFLRSMLHFPRLELGRRFKSSGD